MLETTSVTDLRIRAARAAGHAIGDTLTVEDIALRLNAADAARALGRGATGLLLSPVLAWPAGTALLQSSGLARGLGLLGALALLAALYCGARVLFDARVFAGWARATDPQGAMVAFDVRWGRVDTPPRSLSDRVAGARRWLRRMHVGLLLQVVCLVAILMVGRWGGVALT